MPREKFHAALRTTRGLFADDSVRDSARRLKGPGFSGSGGTFDFLPMRRSSGSTMAGAGVGCAGAGCGWGFAFAFAFRFAFGLGAVGGSGLGGAWVTTSSTFF